MIEEFCIIRFFCVLILGGWNLLLIFFENGKLIMININLLVRLLSIYLVRLIEVISFWSLVVMFVCNLLVVIDLFCGFSFFCLSGVDIFFILDECLCCFLDSVFCF